MSPIIAAILLGVFLLILVGAVMAVVSSLGKRHGRAGSGAGHKSKSRGH